MPNLTLPIASRLEFHDALRAAFTQAAAAGSREIWLCDADFADWPLGERAVVESLSQWAQSQRRLTLLAATYDQVQRRHARWVEWRRQWSHIVQCRSNTDLEAQKLPALLLVVGLVTVRLFDREHHRGTVSSDPADGLRAREAIDAALQRSAEAFPATTTGL